LSHRLNGRNSGAMVSQDSKISRESQAGISLFYSTTTAVPLALTMSMLPLVPMVS
jgi:hypothetical protein